MGYADFLLNQILMIPAAAAGAVVVEHLFKT
jgi:hypothetical protein